MIVNALGGISNLIDRCKNYHHILTYSVQSDKMAGYEIGGLFTKIYLNRLSPPTFSISVEEFVQKTTGL